MNSYQSTAKAAVRPTRRTARQQQKEATRHAILRAARGCFLDAGVAKTSFDDIAARAGVSRATVYLYYSSKEDLLLAMLEADWEAQRALYRLLPPGARSMSDFTAWLGRLIQAYRSRRDSMGLYALVLAQNADMSRRVDQQRDALAAILGEHLSAFALPADSTMTKRVDAHLMIVQIEQFCLMAIRDHWADAVDEGTELLARKLVDFTA